MIGVVYRRETQLSTASEALIKEIRKLTGSTFDKEVNAAPSSLPL